MDDVSCPTTSKSFSARHARSALIDTALSQLVPLSVLRLRVTLCSRFDEEGNVDFPTYQFEFAVEVDT